MKKMFSLVALVFVLSSFNLKKADVVSMSCTDIANYAYNFSLQNGLSNQQANANYNNAFWNCCDNTPAMCKQETVVIGGGSNSGSD